MMKMKKTIMGVIALSLTLGTACGQQTELKFDKDGKFRVLQFTDIHYQQGTPSADRTLRLMRRLIEAEKPDMIAFTGDIVISNPQRPGWDEVLGTAIESRTPYAVVLGNHDDEHDWTRDQIFDYILTRPFATMEKGPAGIKGTGNYVLKVSGREAQTAALLYFFDSGAYAGLDGQDGYDWFGHDQVDWYRRTSRDLSRANGGTTLPALAFFHIPLHEYTLLHDTTKNYVRKAPVFGVRTEKECPGILNTGMFAAMVESADVMGTFVGHDHNNDYIGCLSGVCLAYGRSTGAGSAYNKIGYGARVIVLTEGKREFETWIRDEQNQVLHRVTCPDSFRTPQ
jgi:hypothetical protein